MSELDNRHMRLEEVLERAVGLIGGEGYGGSSAEAGNEMERTMAEARGWMQRERHILDLLSMELQEQGMVREASMGRREVWNPKVIEESSYVAGSKGARCARDRPTHS